MSDSNTASKTPHLEIDEEQITQPPAPFEFPSSVSAPEVKEVTPIKAKSVEELQALEVGPSPGLPEETKRKLRRGPRVSLTSQKKDTQASIKAPRGMPAFHPNPDSITEPVKKNTVRPQPHVFEDQAVKAAIDDLVHDLEESVSAVTETPLTLTPQVELQESLQGAPQYWQPQFEPQKQADLAEDTMSPEDFLSSLSTHRQQNVDEIQSAQLNQSPPTIQVTSSQIQPLQKLQNDVPLQRDMKLAGSCTLTHMINKIHGVESWLAQHDKYGLVVLKLVWPHMLSENAMMWQFDAEIQLLTLQNIQDDTVQSVYDWGEEKNCGAWYVILDWIDGESLSDHLKRKPLPYVQAYQYFLILAQGLIKCHIQGVIHRKIQPSHIVIQEQKPYFISFQWVEEVAGEDLQRKQQGIYKKLGSLPKYLAPEWSQNVPITATADVYALAACMLNAMNPQAQSWRDAPVQLQSAISAALYHDPQARSTAQEFYEDLIQCEWKYEYQSTQGDQVQVFQLHELVQRIRQDELGWHLIRRLGVKEQEKALPWGSCEEVVKAVQRAQRYQPEVDLNTQNVIQDTHSIEAREAVVTKQLKELQAQKEFLQNRLKDVQKQEDEWVWKEEALRVRENELLQKDAAQQENQKRLQQWQEELQQKDIALQQKVSDIEYKEKLVVDQFNEAEDLKADALKLMADTRVLQSDIVRQKEQQQHALDLTESELAAQRALRVHMETDEYQAKVEQAASALLVQRDLEARQEKEKAREAAAAARLAEKARLADIEAQNHVYRTQQEKETRKRMLENLQEGLPFRSSLKSKPKVEKVEKPEEAAVSEVFIGNYCWRLRYCPSGMTWLGSYQGTGQKEEKPRHKIKISRGFWMAETPVTQALWDQIMESNPSQFQGRDRPVEGVTWLEAILFCNALSVAQDLSPAYEVVKENHQTEVLWNREANGYRLPTEAEWEYAARCGQSGQAYQYSNGQELDQVAWFNHNAKGETHAVGLKEANAWGLYDLCGNVWEWCHDTWKKDLYRTRSDGVTRDPVFYQSLLTPRSVRGGAWYDFSKDCRLAYRPGLDVYGPYGVGLRPCLPLS